MKPWEGKTADWVRRLSPYTFGVYLVHEHELVRYRWLEWLHVDGVWGSWMFIPHMIVCVLLIYAVGTGVDFVRTWLFGKIGRHITPPGAKRKTL